MVDRPRLVSEMEYLQKQVLDGMMEELLEEFEPMHVLDLLVQNNIVDTEGQNQIKARLSRKERVMTTMSTLQSEHYDDRWLLRFAEVLEVSAWYGTLGEKLKNETECAMKEVEDIQELYSVSEESFLCLSHLLQIARAIHESDARKLLKYFQVPNTNSSNLGKTLIKGLLDHKIPMLRLQEACSKYKLKYLQDINTKHNMILSFPELQGNFLVRIPASRSHQKGSMLESGTLWESSLFPKETSIKLYVFFRGEYDIHFVKLCDEAKSFCLRITSKRTLDKLLEDNKADVFGANLAKLVYKPINGSKSTPHIRLDFSKSKLEKVRKQLSTSVGYNEEQSTFDYLDMMDRLIQAIHISEIELLCDYFNIDSNYVEKIRGSNNPQRKFIHVCRQNKIWTSKDTSRLVEAVRSNKLTNLEKIIAEQNNDMSLCPEVTVKITPTKPYHATFTKFKQFMLGTKRVSKSEVEEELGINLLFKVSTEESLDKLKTDIDSGRFLQEILTIYKDETGDNAMMISQEERNSIELTYDEKKFKELLRHGANEEKSRQHTFEYLDMMDRLIETMDFSDIDLLCKYFKMDPKSLNKIQGSINPKREFMHVCRRKQIWTSGDTLHLLEAVRSTQLTRLQSIIEDFNDISLCPEVTFTMKSNVTSGAFAEFEEFLLSRKKRLDTVFRREFKVHLVDCEKGSIVFRLKVPSKDSLDQLIGDIHSGRLMEKLMTIYNERTKKEAITILEDVKLSINLSYDTKEVKDAINVLKQHNFTIKDQWKRALMRVQTLMEEELDPFSVMEILTSNGTLTSTEIDALKATAKRKQRVRLFISFLVTKEETAFNSFLFALERCGYHKELVKALNLEVNGSQSGYLLSGDMEDMTEGCQVFGKIDEVIQQCSTEEVDFDIFLDSSWNWNIVRAPAKLFLEEEHMVASASTHKLIKTTKEVEVLAEKGVNYSGTMSNVGNERTNMNDPHDYFLHKMSVAEKVKRFSDEFKDLPTHMRLFTLCLRSLYAENAMGSNAKNAFSTNEISNQTRQDAIVYVKGVLPLCTQVVRCIQEFFEYYEGLELDEWKECLPDILEEVTGYQQCCTEIVRMHEEMMVPLKQRQDEAKVLISKNKDLNEKLIQNKAKLEKDAVNAKSWAIGLLPIPFVVTINGSRLNICADVDLAQAVADDQQVNINEATILIVRDVLIPALSAFIDGLNAVAGFFNIMKEELTTFQSKGERATQDAKLIHYIMMKKKAVEINGSCKEFYAMIPGVRTNLQCIPEKPDDLNYFDKWLIRQQEEIKRKYLQTITCQMSKLLNQMNRGGSTACD